MLDADQITPMMERTNKSVKEKMETNYAVTDKAQIIVHPTDQKMIRTKYTLDKNSIMKKISVPAVGIMHAIAHTTHQSDSETTWVTFNNLSRGSRE